MVDIICKTCLNNVLFLLLIIFVRKVVPLDHKNEMYVVKELPQKGFCYASFFLVGNNKTRTFRGLTTGTVTKIKKSTSLGCLACRGANFHQSSVRSASSTLW